jgi:hypothetical protein
VKTLVDIEFSCSSVHTLIQTGEISVTFRSERVPESTCTTAGVWQRAR